MFRDIWDTKYIVFFTLILIIIAGSYPVFFWIITYDNELSKESDTILYPRISLLQKDDILSGFQSISYEIDSSYGGRGSQYPEIYISAYSIYQNGTREKFSIFFYRRGEIIWSRLNITSVHDYIKRKIPEEYSSYIVEIYNPNPYELEYVVNVVLHPYGFK
jgi:hypothetical protein